MFLIYLPSFPQLVSTRGVSYEIVYFLKKKMLDNCLVDQSGRKSRTHSKSEAWSAHSRNDFIETKPYMDSLANIFCNPLTYMRSDPFEIGTKSIRVSLVFIRDLADPFWIGSPIRYQMDSLRKVIQFGTVRSQGWYHARVNPTQFRLMHQSIPSANIHPGNPRGFTPIFSPGPGDLYHLNCPGVARVSDLLSKYQVVS